MTISRGAFIKFCGLVLVGAGIELPLVVRALGSRVNAAEPLAPAGRLSLHDATADLFRPYLNTAFTVRPADGSPARRLVLAKVGERPLTRNVEQFSLMFHAPPGEALPHAEHAFQHPVLGDFDLFIGPVNAPDDRRVVYQACFSRHLNPREAAGVERERQSL